MMLLRSDLRPIARPRIPRIAMAPMPALRKNMLHALVGSLMPLTLWLATGSAYATVQRLTCFALIEFDMRREIYDASPIACDGKMTYHGTTVIVALPPAVHAVLALIVIIRLPRRGLMSAAKWQLGLVASFPLVVLAMYKLLMWS